MATFQLSELRVPLVTAPMAGGPSTSALVAAAASIGAFGFLAGGYKSAATLSAQVQELRSLTDAPFGVNLFVPAAPLNAAEVDARSAAVAAYSAELEPEAERYGVALSAPDATDTDRWEEKIAWLLEHPVPLVSFTFGIPGAGTMEALKRAGIHVMVTVTDRSEADAAAKAGADSLCLQGPDAGGHRGTHSVAKTPDATPLKSLVERVAAEQSLPIMAAGGVASGAQVSELRRAGASAVQVGTLLLCSPECGASAAHKRALVSGDYADTTVTRAFSGRPARGLTNRFIREHDRTAPAAYPELNQMVRPIRAAAAAAADPEAVALWAGTGYRACRAAPAADILADLWAAAV